MLVFLLALLPRVTSLDTFLTADEDDQLLFAEQFLTAVSERDWAGALVLGYPGVPTMALGALGLWGNAQLSHFQGRFVSAETVQPAAQDAVERVQRIFLPLISRSAITLRELITSDMHHVVGFVQTIRLPMAIAATLMILFLFLALRQLIGNNLALAATILIAFEPYFLANSRIIHVDAPLSYFMVASFLAFLVYLKDGRWGWLFGSGLFGGLAVLSKTPGAILAPILVLGGGLFVWALPAQNRQDYYRRLLVALMAWGALAAIAFVSFWPSMWSKPVYALTTIIGNATGAVNAIHPSSGEFWGPVSDRSPLYYFVAFPFFITPLASIGWLCALIVTALGFKDRIRHRDTNFSRRLPLFVASLIYVILFWAVVSVVGRRWVRYLLPIFPIFDLLAVVGLWELLRRLKNNWGRWLLGGLVCLQAVTILPFHPYYFTYFNPLLGGSRIAPQYAVIGWGEGLDQAARYLNQKPDAESLTVAAWYSWQFANYFHGKTVDLASNDPAYIADYTVFYINQRQRGFPSEELLAYFADREPEKIIKLGGIDYVWIYPGPIIGPDAPAELPVSLNLPFTDALTLLGLDAPSSFSPHSSSFPATLYWQVNGELPSNLNVAIRVVDEAGVVWGRIDRLPIGGLVRTDKWRPGQVIRDEYKIELDPAMPVGGYTFDVLMYNFKTGEILGQANRVGGVHRDSPDGSVKGMKLADWYAGQSLPFTSQEIDLSPTVQLLGNTPPPTETLPGYDLSLKLYWQAKRTPRQDETVKLTARHASGEVIELGATSVGPATYPLSGWQKGQMMGQAVTVAFPPTAPAGEYTVLAQIGDGESASLGQIIVRRPEHSSVLPDDLMPVSVTFGAGNEISLPGYTIDVNDDLVTLTLYWQAQTTLPQNYNVFVHLTGADGAMLAQRDSVPAAATRPTRTWLPGEVIADAYTIPLPPDMQPSQTADLWVGMYNPADGIRLPVTTDNLLVSENRLLLTQIIKADE